MTIPYREWADVCCRSLKYQDSANRTDNIAYWTDDNYNYGQIGLYNDGSLYHGFHMLAKPEDTSFKSESGADEIFNCEINAAITPINANNKTSLQFYFGIGKYPAAPNEWDEALCTGKYYDGTNQWGAYPPIDIQTVYEEKPTITYADLPASYIINTCAYRAIVKAESNEHQDCFFRLGLGFIPTGYQPSAIFGGGDRINIGIALSELKVRYLNPVVNSLSLMRFNPLGGQELILTGIGFHNSDAEIKATNSNNENPTQVGPDGWFAYVTKIQFIGQQGQGTTEITLVGGDFTVDSDTQITIASMPALVEGTYDIKLIKDHGKLINVFAGGTFIEAASYAGDFTCDSDGLMTAGDRFVLMVGTPGANDPNRRDPLFLTKWRFKDADGNIIFRYYSPIDVCASDTFYDGRIIGVSGLQRALDDNTGLYLLPDMTVEMSNTDFEFSKLLAQYMVKNQIVELFHAWSDEPHAWRSHSFIGIVDDVDFKHPVTTFYLKDIFKKYFDKKVPLYRITNEEFPNAHEVAIGQSMPEVLGLNYLNETDCKGAVQAHCIDTTSFIYLAARGNLHSITQVYSDGVLKSTPGDYAVSYDALGYTLITFTASQGDNKVTFNCTGYMYDDWNSANSYVQNPAYIIAFLFAFLAEVPIARLDMVSINALAAKFETAGYEESGRLILQDEKDFEVTLAELLFTYGTKGYPTKEGKFKTEKKDITDFLTAMTIWGQLDVEGQAERKYNYREMIRMI